MKTKKILAILLAIMMFCSIMSITAFADDQYTVTIYLERIFRDEDNEVTTHYSLNGGVPLTIVVNSGTNLKGAINGLCNQTNPVISNSVWGNNDGEYLTSLKVGTTTFTNNDNFYYNTPSVGLTTYIGSSWMYFEGTPNNIPETTYIYPDVSLYNRTVLSNVTITLSFENQTFVW